MRTGVKSEAYKSIVTATKIGKVFRRDAKSIENDLVCTTCATVADAVIAARRLGISRETLYNVVVNLCVDLDVEAEEVCTGTIGSNIVSEMNQIILKV